MIYPALRGVTKSVQLYDFSPTTRRSGGGAYLRSPERTEVFVGNGLQQPHNFIQGFGKRGSYFSLLVAKVAKHNI